MEPCFAELFVFAHGGKPERGRWWGLEEEEGRGGCATDGAEEEKTRRRSGETASPYRPVTETSLFSQSVRKKNIAEVK